LGSFVVIFFLLFLSTAHLIQTTFIIGFIAGGIGVYLNAIYAASEDKMFLQDNLLTMLVAYILAGMISAIVIYLNRKQFNYIEDLLVTNEQAQQKKEQEHNRLENSTSNIVSNITEMNSQIQDNIHAQSEISKAISELAAGSETQNERISDIVQASENTQRQMQSMLQNTKSLKEQFEISNQIAKDGNDLSYVLSENTAKFQM